MFLNTEQEWSLAFSRGSAHGFGGKGRVAFLAVLLKFLGHASTSIDVTVLQLVESLFQGIEPPRYQLLVGFEAQVKLRTRLLPLR